VLDLPANGRSRAYVDGKKVKTTGKDKFRVRVNPRRMSPGKHRLVIKTRDAEGKMVKKVVTFLVCPR
jgi:hypothetical protein